MPDTQILYPLSSEETRFQDPIHQQRSFRFLLTACTSSGLSFYPELRATCGRQRTFHQPLFLEVPAGSSIPSGSLSDPSFPEERSEDTGLLGDLTDEFAMRSGISRSSHFPYGSPYPRLARSVIVKVQICRISRNFAKLSAINYKIDIPKCCKREISSCVNYARRFPRRMNFHLNGIQIDI